MKVFLSPQAESKLKLLLNYLLENWNVKIRDEFVKLLSSKLNQISTHPKSCPQSEVKTGIYKCVLSKQTTFFYRIKNMEIEIITFFDTRQNPDKLNSEL